MKQFLIASFFVLITGLGAKAQEAQNKQKGLTLNTETMTKLGLSTEQQQKITAIIKQKNAEIRAVKADASLSEDMKNAKVKELVNARSAQQDSVFTKQQKQDLLKMKRELKAKQEQGS